MGHSFQTSSGGLTKTTDLAQAYPTILAGVAVAPLERRVLPASARHIRDRQHYGCFSYAC